MPGSGVVERGTGGVLRRGFLAGAAAGVSLALFVRLVGEPTLARAIALEAQRSRDFHEEELFSRGAQQIGGMVGAVVYGVCVGLIAAVVLASVGRRSPARIEWRRSMAFAGVAFVAVVLVPSLKYPASPPGVGDPATVGRRTLLFVALLAWSLLASWATWRLWLRLQEKGWLEHRRWAAAVLLYAGAVTAALVLMPGSSDVVDVPASLVWRFRMASLGGAAVFWAVMGWVQGALAHGEAATAG